MGPEDWEGAAAELLDATCSSGPVDMRRLASACRFDLRGWRCTDAAQLRGSTRSIVVDEHARHERQQGLIAHELGHFALQRSALAQSERAASYVAGALRYPRREALIDFRSTRWSITALRELHPHVSATAIGVRITQLRRAVLSLFDPLGRVRPWRVASSDVHGELARRAHPLEHELAIEAWMQMREIRSGNLCVATPLFDEERGVHRVLVVCDAAELEPAQHGEAA